MSGIASKLAFIFSLFALIYLGTAYKSTGVFQRVASDMSELNEARVPDLVARTEVLNIAGRIREVFASMLLSETPATVDDLGKAAETALSELDEHIQPESDAAVEVANLRTKIIELTNARKSEFRHQQHLSELTGELEQAAETISALLNDAQQLAISDMALTSQETSDLVENTLTGLVEGEFAALKVALLARAFLNENAGVAMALSGATNPAYRTLLSELAVTADTGLEGLRSQIDETESLQPLVAPIKEFRQAVSGSLSGARSNIETVIAARNAAEKAIISVIDEIEFNLFITTDEVKEANNEAIKGLVDVQVNRIIAAAKLAATVRRTVIAALEIGAAGDNQQIDEKLGILTMITADLAALVDGENEETAQAIERLMKPIDQTNGIPAVRRSELEARTDAKALANEAARSIFLISSISSDALGESLAAIAESSSALETNVEDARSLIFEISAGAGLILVLSFLGALFTIVRPLKIVAAETERLSEGKLDPIAGMDKYRGEIGQMVGALKIFRSRMLDRIRLEEEQQEAASEREAARQKAARAEVEAREREQAAKDERRREKQATERAEAARRAELEASAEAERKARADELNMVVTTLAHGLGQLSEGNLDAYILDDFPDAYAQLRNDFNQAVERLSGLLMNISDAGATIREASQEISASAIDLSQRTEVSASTLEETARSLRELAKSVQSTATGAESANEIGRRTVSTAEAGAEVVQDCVNSMNSVETSSRQISTVVAVIDDIAFQTNLLALNAGVEAARAGDSGRGFAVVASEVRALAQRSSDAAREINELITDSEKVVAKGVEATGKAGTSLDDIVAAVTEMAQQIAEITGAAVQQSASIDEISKAAGELDNNTQQNAALFEETTAANQRLSAEAEALDAQLKQFILPGQAKAAKTPEEEWKEAI